MHAGLDYTGNIMSWIKGMGSATVVFYIFVGGKEEGGLRLCLGRRS